MHTSKISLDGHIGFHLLAIGWTLLVLATSCQLRQARGQDKEGPIPSNKAEDAHELHREHEKVFPDAALSEVASLQCSADAGIALRASWELVRRSMKRAAPQSGPVGTLDRLKVERFIGFVEGRLRIQLPEWWSDLLRKGSYYSGHSGVWLDTERASAPYRKSESGLFAPVGTRVTTEGADLRVTHDSDSMVIPATVLANAKEQIGDPWGISVLFLDRFRRLVAIFGDGFAEYPLFMLDTNSARPVWQAKVWADVPKGGFGSMNHWVSLYSAEDMILVVGATDYAAYVEGFSITDGRNLFRFSTSY